MSKNSKKQYAGFPRCPWTKKPGMLIGNFKKLYMVIRWKYRGRYLIVPACKINKERGTITFKSSININETNHCIIVAFFLTILEEIRWEWSLRNVIYETDKNKFIWVSGFGWKSQPNPKNQIIGLQRANYEEKI